MRRTKLLAWLLSLAMVFSAAPSLTLADVRGESSSAVETEADYEEPAENQEASYESEESEVSSFAESEIAESSETQGTKENADSEAESELVSDQASALAEFSSAVEITESNETSADTASADMTAAEEAEGNDGNETITEPSGYFDESYHALRMDTLYNDNLLIIPDDMKTNLTIAPDTDAKGLLITGTAEAMSSGKITLGHLVNFDGNAVSRISIDGLAPKRTVVKVEVYLDDADSPAATIQLKKQKKTNRWTDDGAVTSDVLDQNITGEHKVSLRIVSSEAESQTLLLRSLEFAQVSLPMVYLDIDESEGTIAEMNSDDDHDTECYGNMTLETPAGYTYEYGKNAGKTTEKLSTETYSMEYIRGRGNSTWSMDKKPYKIKLDDKANLLGMGKNKHWILLANRYDNSQMRNKFTYDLGAALGMEFTPKCVFVEVVMNGDYLGSYYLCEQIRVGSNRVDIDDLEDSDETKAATDPETISGGYLLSMEPYGDETNPVITTDHGNKFLIESPSYEDYTNQTQIDYITNYIQKTEDAIYGDQGKNSDGESWSDLMDLDSAANYWLIQDISLNGDAFGTTSTYLYKKRNGKLYWGPLWDFDFVAWGDTDYSEDPAIDGFEHRDISWFGKLFSYTEFGQAVVDRWPAIRDELLKRCESGGAIDKYTEMLSISNYYDRETWGTYNDGSGEELTLAQEADRFRSWIEKRVAWVDENINSLIPQEYKVTFVDRGKTIAEKTYSSLDTLSNLPEAPANSGFVFGGWYDDNDCRYRNGDVISSDMTLYAQWLTESEIVPVKAIYLERSKMATYSFQEEFCLNYEIVPYNATDCSITWSSSNEAIATVDEFGTVDIKAAGDVTITARANNNVSASCQVKILEESEEENYALESMNLDKSSLQLKVGAYDKVTPVYSPEFALYDTASTEWISTNSDIASVDYMGVVTANSPGTTSIICIAGYGSYIQTCQVTVTDDSKTTPKKTVTKTVKKGDTFTSKGLKYRVTSIAKGKQSVCCIGRAKTSLTKVTVPAAVKYKKVSYKVTAIGKNAFKNTNISSAVLGSNISSIGQGAFESCKKLSKLTLGKSVKVISADAFKDCRKLKKVTLGKAVKTIGSNAFKGCKKLKRVTFKGKVSSIGNNAFKGVSKKAVFKVPSGKKKAYRNMLKKKSGTGFSKKTMKVK